VSAFEVGRKNMASRVGRFGIERMGTSLTIAPSAARRSRFHCSTFSVTRT